MISNELWIEAGNWSFYLLTGASLLFFIVYGLLSPWWKTDFGRNIAAVMGSLALTTTYFAIVFLWGRIPPGFYPTRFLLFLFLGLAVTWRLVIFLREQFHVRRPKIKEEQR